MPEKLTDPSKCYTIGILSGFGISISMLNTTMWLICELKLLTEVIANLLHTLYYISVVSLLIFIYSTINRWSSLALFFSIIPPDSTLDFQARIPTVATFLRYKALATLAGVIMNLNSILHHCRIYLVLIFDKVIFLWPSQNPL